MTHYFVEGLISSVIVLGVRLLRKFSLLRVLHSKYLNYKTGLIFLFVWIFSASETVVALSKETISSPITPEDIAKANEILIQMDLINKIASYNIQYLAISVSIILFVGGVIIGLFYLLSVKPLQDSILKHEGKFNVLNKDIDDKFRIINENFTAHISSQTAELQESLSLTRKEVLLLKQESAEKISNAEKKTIEFIQKTERESEKIKDEYQDGILDSIWNQHWMWDGQEVHMNTLSTLVEYMEKALSWNKIYILDLWFSRVTKVLQKLDKKDTEDDYGKRVHSSLVKILDKIKGKETEKSLLKKEMDKLFN